MKYRFLIRFANFFVFIGIDCVVENFIVCSENPIRFVEKKRQFKELRVYVGANEGKERTNELVWMHFKSIFYNCDILLVRFKNYLIRALETLFIPFPAIIVWMWERECMSVLAPAIIQSLTEQIIEWQTKSKIIEEIVKSSYSSDLRLSTLHLTLIKVFESSVVLDVMHTNAND